MKISNQLKKARKDKKLTQEYVASQINVSRKTISSWENGRGQPNSEYLKQLNSIYNTNLQLHYTQKKYKHNNKYFYIIYFIILMVFILCLINVFTGIFSGVILLQLLSVLFFCITYKINIFYEIKKDRKNFILFSSLSIILLIIIMNNLEFKHDFSNILIDIPFFIGSLLHSLIMAIGFFIITNYRNGK
ncbi:helix-turn-helix transcriptional regulator [Apilactobacillus micheneri]|uniref:helix-turn-helix transcriptional regulator n=1 Tax=Apilactobacillus micheneri TaxID=1899430 RepID=UPI0015E85532|nr:helix-turn-helix transcriptional regulator [Apilactobacillus micheneri]